jgi:hypothetical protein
MSIPGIGGKPLKFKTVEELQKKIDNYFKVTPREEWTITGLALHLDTFRIVLLDYQYNRPAYTDAIKRAKQKIENGYEIDLKKHGRAGTIFALKNFNWKDRNETDFTSGGEKIDSLINIFKTK